MTVSTTIVDQLSREQISILKHTATRAARGLYCGDSSDMQVLVELGLMVSAGRVSYVPDEYFRMTEQGRSIAKALIAAETIPLGPKLTKRKAAAKRRYQAYLEADYLDVSFIDFVRKYWPQFQKGPDHGS